MVSQVHFQQQRSSRERWRGDVKGQMGNTQHRSIIEEQMRFSSQRFLELGNNMDMLKPPKLIPMQMIGIVEGQC